METSLPSPKSTAHDLVESLRRSAIFQEYRRAFCDTTGLPLKIIEATSRTRPFRCAGDENPFCALVTQTEEGCSCCTEIQKRSADSKTAGDAPVTFRCLAGLCDTLVPVKLGDETIAYLQTGQVFLREPNRQSFTKTAKLLLKLGLKAEVKHLESAYFSTRIVTPRQYDAMLRLLRVFAKHLSDLSNRIVVESAKPTHPKIESAQRYIREHQKEPLTLTEVAKRVNVSAQYLSALFHRASGITFTDYLARVRVEQAKVLLSDPQNRISEVAFAVGFESLSQFNRVFRRIVGQSPTKARAKLLKAKTRA